MAELPYIPQVVTVVKRLYNPNFGDHRICRCGHSYYRHFDSFDDMLDVGCKYCPCDTFNEDPEKNGCIKRKDDEQSEYTSNNSK